MSVDSKLYLPPTTRLRDFAQVLGILLGCGVRQIRLDNQRPDDDSVFLEVTNPPTFNGSNETLVCSIGGFWHWEPDDSPIPGARLFTCRMKDNRRPVLVALADVFGGLLDFNDCDAVDVDHLGTLYRKPYRPDATDGEEWDTWQRYKLALEPISTIEEWMRW